MPVGLMIIQKDHPDDAAQADDRDHPIIHAMRRRDASYELRLAGNGDLRDSLAKLPARNLFPRRM